MRLALRLARLGMGRTHPNPRVGAVAVRNGSIVGLGAHLECGGAHAEGALIGAAAEGTLRGATLYVTLEPCAHKGKVGPCAPAIVQAGFRRVVAAMEDPNPIVRGRGIGILRASGIQMDVGVLGGAAAMLNAPFLWSLTRKRAFVTLKIAASLDGRVAAADGSSRWISGSRAREQVQRWRASCDAILIGRGTLEADGPRLTARPVSDPLARLRARLRAMGGAQAARGGSWPHQPARIVVDSRARTAQREDLLGAMARSPGGPWIVACAERAPAASIQRLERAGVRCWVLPQEKSEARVDLRALTVRLAENGLLDLLVEGGATLASRLVRQDLVDRFRIFLAPVLLGGPRQWAADLGFATLGEARRLAALRVRRVGCDALLEALSRSAARMLRAQGRAGCTETG